MVSLDAHPAHRPPAPHALLASIEAFRCPGREIRGRSGSLSPSCGNGSLLAVSAPAPAVIALPGAAWTKPAPRRHRGPTQRQPRRVAGRAATTSKPKPTAPPTNACCSPSPIVPATRRLPPSMPCLALTPGRCGRGSHPRRPTLPRINRLRQGAFGAWLFQRFAVMIARARRSRREARAMAFAPRIPAPPVVPQSPEARSYFPSRAYERREPAPPPGVEEPNESRGTDAIDGAFANRAGHAPTSAPCASWQPLATCWPLSS